MIACEETTEATVERLQDLVLAGGQTLDAGGLAVRPHLVAGIARAGIDADDAERLLDCATAATSQQDMATRVAVFSPKAREMQREILRFEDDLRAALDGNQFLLHFQPVVDLDAGRATSAEALLRWQHPELGMMPPGRFIPIAEKSGLIRPIGYWCWTRPARDLPPGTPTECRNSASPSTWRPSSFTTRTLSTR